MNQKLIKQFAKYFGAAIIGYAVDFGSLILFKEILHVHYLVSAAIGFTLGLIVLYIISNRYVFGKSKIQSKTYEFMLFTIIGLIGLGILTVLMWALTDGAHINYLISKILATVVVYGWNFFARRKLYHD
jgi:putative flippase GtrA